MRKLAFLVLTISLLLCGCNGVRTGEETMTKFSEDIALAQKISAEAEISADVGGKAFDFTVNYTKNAEEERVEILAPENIAGISAVIQNGGASLHYDGLILAIGSITQNGISPMNVLTLAFDAISHGNFSEVRAESDGETEMTAAEYFLTDIQSVTLYLDENAIPKYITISENGKTVVECKILSFEISLE
ncbi:MAG: hypothetical protein IKV47_08145 [Oscillospiraceae bacterium]|nr:hypothetical protein [Oscillospiraceae bacterium]